MNASFTYNDAPTHYNLPAAYQNPTNIDKQNGGQSAPESTASGQDETFLNPKWQFRMAGAYRTLWQDIGLAASVQSRQGCPFLPVINLGSRPNRAGGVEVLLDSPDDARLPNYITVDLKVDKEFWDDRPGSGAQHVQRLQPKHDSEAAADSECIEREPRCRDAGAAHRAVSAHSEVLTGRVKVETACETWRNLGHRGSETRKKPSDDVWCVPRRPVRDLLLTTADKWKSALHGIPRVEIEH